MPQQDDTEPAPQAGAVPNQHRASALKRWSVTFGIAAVLLTTVYGITIRRYEEQKKQSETSMNNISAPLQHFGGATANASPADTRPGG